jgi:hypothetical protein
MLSCRTRSIRLLYEVSCSDVSRRSTVLTPSCRNSQTQTPARRFIACCIKATKISCDVHVEREGFQQQLQRLGQPIVVIDDANRPTVQIGRLSREGNGRWEVLIRALSDPVSPHCTLTWINHGAASGLAHRLERGSIEKLDAMRVGKRDCPLAFERRQSSADRFDRQSEIVCNIVARHRQIENSRPIAAL